MSRSNWTLYGLHLLLALSLPLMLVVLTGCPQAKPTKEDLGAEVAPQTIDQALYDAEGDLNLNRLAVGQYVEFVDERQILDQDITTTIGGRRIDVIDSDPKKHDYTLRITQSTRNADGTFSTVVSEEPLVVSDAASMLVAEAMPLATTPPQKVSFYHLRQSDGYMDPPDKVKGEADCGGLSPCQIKVHYVQFDMVLWQDDTNYQKISMDLAVSAQTPYLPYGNDLFSLLNGALVTNCQSTFVPYEGSQIYVRDCSSLDDFHF